MQNFKLILIAILVLIPSTSFAACNSKALYKQVDTLIDNEIALDDDIHIKVAECDLTLSGRVDSDYELDLAKRVISTVDGIHNLYFKVKVEKDSFFSSKYEMTSVEARP